MVQTVIEMNPEATATAELCAKLIEANRLLGYGTKSIRMTDDQCRQLRQEAFARLGLPESWADGQGLSFICGTPIIIRDEVADVLEACLS